MREMSPSVARRVREVSTNSMSKLLHSPHLALRAVLSREAGYGGRVSPERSIESYQWLRANVLKSDANTLEISEPIAECLGGVRGSVGGVASPDRQTFIPQIPDHRSPLAGEDVMRSVAGEGSVNKFNTEVVALPSPGATRRPLPQRGRGRRAAPGEGSATTSTLNLLTLPSPATLRMATSPAKALRHSHISNLSFISIVCTPRCDSRSYIF